MALILRLAVIFNVPRRSVCIDRVRLHLSANVVDLVVPNELRAENPLLEPNLGRETAYLAALGLELKVVFSADSVI